MLLSCANPLHDTAVCIAQVCVFNMCELLKDRYEDSWGEQQEQEGESVATPEEEAAEDAAGAQEQRPEQPGNDEEQRMATAIVTGEAYTERKSTFQVLQPLHGVVFCNQTLASGAPAFYLLCGLRRTCKSLSCPDFANL